MAKKRKNKIPMTRSENMSRIRSKETAVEVKLRKKLWFRGLRYRKNWKDIVGKPDIVFKNEKVAVFCDGEFWHGKDFSEETCRIKSNRDYWVNKIKRNIARDKTISETLEKEGWLVLRYWSKNILKNTEQIADEIENAVLERRILGVLLS